MQVQYPEVKPGTRSMELFLRISATVAKDIFCRSVCDDVPKDLNQAEDMILDFFEKQGCTESTSPAIDQSRERFIDNIFQFPKEINTVDEVVDMMRELVDQYPWLTDTRGLIEKAEVREIKTDHTGDYMIKTDITDKLTQP